MVKQKQEVISRFFAPKPKPQTPSSLPYSSSSSPPPKITTTVSFSPSKRLHSSQFHNTSSKRSKLSPHTHNPIPSSFPSDPSLHQKFLQKLLEPTDHVLEPSQKPHLKYTPLEQQVVELKGKYPDVVLMIEVGYKYRFFGKDAEIAARVLGIYAHVDHSFLTASIPTFRLNVHVRRLVSQGYKVGVVKQTETAKIKAHGSNRVGPFLRGLSALYTKATIEAAEVLGGGEEGCGGLNNYLVCVVERDVLVENLECGIESGFEVKIGVVAIEISTGDVVYGEFNDNFMRGGLEAILLSLSPAELLLGEPLSGRTEKLLTTYAGPASHVRLERASCDCFKDGGALASLMSVFEYPSHGDFEHEQDRNEKVSADGINGLAIKGIMGMPTLVVLALAVTIQHLKQFGLERILSLGASFRPFSSNTEMNLSANTLQQLEVSHVSDMYSKDTTAVLDLVWSSCIVEVLKNNTNGSESGSLLKTMNHTLTIFGQRLLRHWVAHPLCDRSMIEARLDAVSEIAKSMGGFSTSDGSEFPSISNDISCVLSSVLTTLAQSTDVQRGITRIYHKTATPSEFVAIVQAILLAAKKLQLHGIEVIRSPLLRNLIQIGASSCVIASSAKLLSTLNKDAAEKGDLLNLISIDDGQFFEVAEARTKVQSANEKLDLLIILFRKKLSKPKLDFMTVAGTTHLIELPSDAKVPSNWVKVNSTKKTVRYHPPEVLTALDQLSLANEELAVVCREAWDNFLGEFSRNYAEFQATVHALAALDCLHSLAILSRTKNYVRPIFVDDNEPVQIQISSGRHPVLETVLQDNFVPNDTYLDGDGQYCQIITGPNMGGKSCYIRQVALIALMAQVGSFVPASSAKLHVLDAIYTRMGASDNIQQGRSTFLEELSEASNILRTSSDKSLVILDELGRGTSTHDGVAIAYATLHHLLEKKRCMLLFVTHYPKIADILLEFPDAVGTYHVSYLTSQKHKNIYPKSGKNDGKMEHEDVTYLYKLVSGISQRSFGFKVAHLAQLPPSCIERAIVMATRLESLVQTRTRKHQQKPLFSEAPFTVGHDSSTNDETEIMSQSGVSFRDFFRNLWSSLESDDVSQSREILNAARSYATELTNW